MRVYLREICRRRNLDSNAICLIAEVNRMGILLNDVDVDEAVIKRQIEKIARESSACTFKS